MDTQKMTGSVTMSAKRVGSRSSANSSNSTETPADAKSAYKETGFD